MKALILALLLFSFSPVTSMAAPKILAMSFVYQSEDGSVRMPCTYSVLNQDGHDYLVQCAEGALSKSYVVHVWLSQYSHPTEPKTTFELLYWIDDRSGGQPTSTSFWFSTKDVSEFGGIDIRLSVEKDTSSLWMNLK